MEFIHDANYYNAICTLMMGDTSSAIMLYKKVVESTIPNHQESALTFLAREYYKSDNFELSNKYYLLLEEVASTNSLTL